MKRTAAVLAVGVCAGLGVIAAAQPSTTTKIVMLGTGTPRPTPDRSGPATAIVVGDRAYLVDFGPGVIRRAAAAQAKGIAPLEPTRITTAFVTHLHSDHTTGYPDLILAPWVMGRTAALNVYGPAGLEEMTADILHAWRRDIEIRTTGLEQRPPLVVHAHDVKPGVAYKDDRVTVTAFRVAHGQWEEAFGYRFDTPDRTIVISGDTSPSEEVVAHCRPCDVLIHEAYSINGRQPPMENWDTYRTKYHTSTDELAALANKAKPGLLILYHQSGRAPDDQMVREVQKTYSGKVVIAHDLDIY